MSAPIQLPGAWYDLSCRVSEAQAVASCALEALPNGLQGVAYERMNNASHLIAAVQDILMLMEKDVNLIEEQLKNPQQTAQPV